METPIFRELLAAGAVRGVVAKGVPGGYILSVQIEGGERILTTQRGQSRVFKKLDAIASYSRELGLSQFTVDLQQWAKLGLL